MIQTSSPAHSVDAASAIIPDAVLNRIAAQVCGWKWWRHNGRIPSPRWDKREEAFLLPGWLVTSNLIAIEGDPDAAIVRVYGQERCPIPDYCQDRNGLHTLLLAVRAAGKKAVFEEIVWKVLDDNDGELDYSTSFDLLLSAPRLQVECALRALGVWPEGQPQAQEQQPIKGDTTL